MIKPPRALTAPRRPPRRLSRLPLPAYRHVPGLTPHPVKDRRGHSYDLREPLPSVECTRLPSSWKSCAEYLYGVDLFNRAYLWEAHEVWEVVWNGAGHDSLPGTFVQGLIQVSAALLRLHLGTARGAASLFAKAQSRFDEVEERLRRSRRRSYMGLALAGWRGSVGDLLAERSSRYPFLRLRL